MGQGSSISLKEVSVEDLALFVEGLGAKYVSYGQSVRDNAVDGALLATLDESSFKETLEDLEVSRLHQRVLTKEWNKWTERKSRQQVESTICAPPTRRSSTAKDLARALAKEHPEYVLEHSIALSEEQKQELFEAAASYELTEDTPDDQLECFGRTASKALALCRARYAGVHLLDDDGHTALASRLCSCNDGVEVLRTERMHAPRELSSCYGAILGEESDFVVRPLDPEKTPLPTPEDGAQYIAHIIKTPEGKRIGVVCAVVDKDREHDKREERYTILKELAAETEEQLRLRKVLLDRNKMLRDQVNELKAMKKDEVVQSHGPVRAITQQDLDRRESWYPMPDELAASGKPRKSSALPLIQEMRAKPEEMIHLPDDFYALADAMGADHAPIPRDDMERVAVLESLGLPNLTHDHPTGTALKRLVTMGCNLFHVPYGEITFQNHSSYYTFARHCELSEEQKNIIFSFYTTLNKDETGEPWLVTFPEKGRCLSFCNYALTAKKTMTVHDVWEDESFKWMSDLDGFKFYSGSPIFVNGYAVATFCMMDFQPRPDFSIANEIQQEQIAMLMSHQIETWALRRDMLRLEEEKRRLETPLLKAAPPNQYAALVLTDVQGSTTLWESNPEAMNEAITLHDQVIRKCIGDHHGYEVSTEGDAFHIAFHDAIDAVSFALEAQSELHSAGWSDEILALPESCCTDDNAFRGLRVRMGVHAGPLKCRDNEVSGRREYTGPALYICRSLEAMAHGGQILVSSDVWNVASHLSESKLGSPQVLDLGTHVLLQGKSKQDGVVTKTVLQLVPSHLAYDFMRHRSQSIDSSSSSVSDTGTKHLMGGRRFPQCVSLRRLSSSFLEAPFKDNLATVTFVYTSQIEALYDEASTILAILAKRIGVLLNDQPGYQCKDFMLAFSSPSEAIFFGLKLQEDLKVNQVADKSLAGLVQVGLHEGTFSSMGPHKTTGRADYLGKVVNRAARVAGAAAPGEVCLGISGNEIPLLDDGLEASFVGKRQLKGVHEEMWLYVCSRRVDVSGHDA